MRSLILVSALLLTGCAARKPIVVKLTPRQCPALSVTHVACLPGGESPSCGGVGHLEQICEDTATHGVFDMAMGYNPYQNVDGEDRPRAKDVHPWWKFWVKGKDYKDND